MSHTTSPALLASLIVASLADVGTTGVFVVDDGGGPGVFSTTIQPAIDAAAAGDTVLVKAGDYPEFTIVQKGLSVLVEHGETAVIRYNASPGVEIRHTPSTQPTLVRGFEIKRSLSPLGDPVFPALIVGECAGSVVIEDCDVYGGSITQHGVDAGQPGARIAGSSCVSLLRCTLFGGRGWDDFGFFLPPATDGGDALVTLDSQISLWDCELRGGDGGYVDTFLPSTNAGANGGNGATVHGGTLFLSASTLTGGDGGGGGYAPNILACGPGGDGGHGLQLAGAAPIARQLDGSIEAGKGAPAGGAGAPPQCSPDGVDGDPILIIAGIHTLLPGESRSLTLQSNAREQLSLSLDMHGQAGDSVFGLVSASSDCVYLPTHQGVLTPTLPAILVPLGVLPALGSAQLLAAIPNLGSGIQDVRIFMQCAHVGPTGAIQLGAPSTTVLLDHAVP